MRVSDRKGSQAVLLVQESVHELLIRLNRLLVLNAPLIEKLLLRYQLVDQIPQLLQRVRLGRGPAPGIRHSYGSGRLVQRLQIVALIRHALVLLHTVAVRRLLVPL